jgi:aspartyl-tRNA(Asn)/glutamyl-tRNA(Gln) amidotransferase subunit B
VERVVAENPKAVADYRAGKPTVGFLVGQVMKATGGQANAGLVQGAVRAWLDAVPADDSAPADAEDTTGGTG